jgi:hypothetical protein
MKVDICFLVIFDFFLLRRRSIRRIDFWAFRVQLLTLLVGISILSIHNFSANALLKPAPHF